MLTKIFWMDDLMIPRELTGLQERIEKIFRSLIKMIDIDNCILFERIESVQFNLNFDRILLSILWTDWTELIQN